MAQETPTNDSADRLDPHVPTPREHELSDGDLAVSSHWVHGTRDATTVAAEDQPLYRLLMDILGETHVPDLMPARLATACRDLVAVKEAVENIDRGRADIGGVGWGTGYCYCVRDAIEEYRDRAPVRLVAVGCSGTKNHDADPLPAADRYAGGYWTNKREYAEAVGDEWRIISAEHAVLAPSDLIHDYETTPDDLEGVPVHSDERLPSGDPVRTMLDLWALNVHNGLARWLQSVGDGIDPRDVDLAVLLGRTYEDPLRDRDVFDALRIPGDLSVSFPFREVDGLTGIGEQRSWMADEADKAGGSA